MTWWMVLALGIDLAAGAPSAVSTERTSAPAARREPKVDALHGDKRLDEYFWLRRKEDPQVRAYLEAENAYTDLVMKPTEALQESLYSEILGRIKETDLTVPYRKGEYLYYSRTEKGKQYPILCRKGRATGAREEIILDQNELAKGEKFFAIGDMEVSDDGNGIDPAMLAKPKAFGLRGLHERARTVGGWLDISSRPGQGTSVILSVPLTSPSSPPAPGDAL